jgi:predicted phage gp36 major capsid-like protein
MATQTNVPQLNQQSKLAIVPFPAPQAITQLELTALLSLRARFNQLEKQIETAESSIKTRLEAGCSIEEGDHHAELKENFRRNVSWKDVASRLADRLKLNGATYCARVLAATKPTKTTALVVE